MRRSHALLVILLGGALLAACGGSSTTGGRGTPTPQPTETPRPGTYYFTTEDGVTLNGRVLGQGKTAVVFSSQVDASGDLWAPVAQEVAGRGYMTMTYDYRGIGQSQGAHQPDAGDRDLRAAIKEVRSRGATSVALVGASLGGLITVKVAATETTAAVVVLSAPNNYGKLRVNDDDLRAITAPKLFAVARDDRAFTGPVQYMFDTAPQPKEIYVYDGNDHGVVLLLGPQGKDLAPRFFAFLQKYAPPA